MAANGNKVLFTDPIISIGKPYVNKLLIRVIFLCACFATVSVARESLSLLPIGKIQGAVWDKHDGLKHESPFNQKRVKFSGVIHQQLSWATAFGEIKYAVLMQNQPEESDRDPYSSDGIFVYLGNALRIKKAGGFYRPKVGDWVVLEGKVNERYRQTEIVFPELIKIKERNVVLARHLKAIPLRPPHDRDQAMRYWECIEGMRVHLPKGSIVQGGSHMEERARDRHLWVLPAKHNVAQRAIPLHRRVFRDPHPLDDDATRLFDNQNGFLVSLSSIGLKKRLANIQVQLPAVKTFDQINADLVGGVIYQYGSYRICPERSPHILPHTSYTVPKWPKTGSGKLSVATFNVENLYDFENDPHDEFDHVEDGPGPIRYAPKSSIIYKEKIERLAKQCVRSLGSPDLMLLQEIEGQDIRGASGVLDVLEDLVGHIISLGGVRYEVAADIRGVDERGILSAYLFNPQKLTLASSEKVKNIYHVAQNPFAWNDIFSKELPVFSRPVQVALFEYRGKGGATHDLFVLNNHFTSRPNKKIKRRMAQAQENAKLIERVLEHDKDAWIICGGDLNVFPRPDDPMPENLSDQLKALYDVGIKNVYDRLVRDEPESAYTYVYKGEAGALDHLFLSPSLHRRLERAGVLHLNADWPKASPVSYFGISDHDPLLIHLTLP